MNRLPDRVQNRLILLGVAAVTLTGLWLTLNPSAFANLIILALNAAVPIALAATGEIINERGGLVNVGVEGVIIAGAFSAVYAAEQSGNPYGGLAGGVATGALIGGAFAYVATHGRGVQVIAGFGVNMIALGLVALLLLMIWTTPGFHLLTSDALRVPRLRTPWGGISWLVPVTLLVAALTHVCIDQTRFGSRLRAAGYNPFVTDAAGIDVYRLRILACTIGGALAGLAGAYLSLDYLGSVTKNVAQGRGFIALACLVFSGLDVFLAVGIALLFGLAEGLSLWLQNVPWAKEFVQRGGGFLFLTLPYVSVLVALLAFPRLETLSKAVGETYRRSE